MEGWEKEMNEEDWLNFNWKKSRSKENIDAFLSKMGESIENKVFLILSVLRLEKQKLFD